MRHVNKTNDNPSTSSTLDRIPSQATGINTTQENSPRLRQGGANLPTSTAASPFGRVKGAVVGLFKRKDSNISEANTSARSTEDHEVTREAKRADALSAEERREKQKNVNQPGAASSSTPPPMAKEYSTVKDAIPEQGNSNYARLDRSGGQVQEVDDKHSVLQPSDAARSIVQGNDPDRLALLSEFDPLHGKQNADVLVSNKPVPQPRTLKQSKQEQTAVSGSATAAVPPLPPKPGQASGSATVAAPPLPPKPGQASGSATVAAPPLPPKPVKVKFRNPEKQRQWNEWQARGRVSRLDVKLPLPPIQRSDSQSSSATYETLSVVSSGSVTSREMGYAFLTNQLEKNEQEIRTLICDVLKDYSKDYPVGSKENKEIVGKMFIKNVDGMNIIQNILLSLHEDDRVGRAIKKNEGWVFGKTKNQFLRSDGSYRDMAACCLEFLGTAIKEKDISSKEVVELLNQPIPEDQFSVAPPSEQRTILYLTAEHPERHPLVTERLLGLLKEIKDISNDQDDLTTQVQKAADVIAQNIRNAYGTDDYDALSSDNEVKKNCIAILNGMRKKQILPSDFDITWLEQKTKECFPNNRFLGRPWTASDMLKKRELYKRKSSEGRQQFASVGKELLDSSKIQKKQLVKALRNARAAQYRAEVMGLRGRMAASEGNLEQRVVEAGHEKSNFEDTQGWVTAKLINVTNKTAEEYRKNQRKREIARTDSNKESTVRSKQRGSLVEPTETEQTDITGKNDRGHVKDNRADAAVMVAAPRQREGDIHLLGGRQGGDGYYEERGVVNLNDPKGGYRKTT